MTSLVSRLLVSVKGKTATDPSYLPTAFRQIEEWANQEVGASGIQEITSTGGTITVTNPTGPITDLEAASGTTYKSLTGPGETTTPGDLTQAGGFTVNDTAGHGISLNADGTSIGVAISSNGGITLQENTGSPGGVLEVLNNSAGGTVIGDAGSGLTIQETGTGSTLITITQSPSTNGGAGIEIEATGGKGITISTLSGAGGVELQSAAGGIQINSSGGSIIIQTTGGFALSNNSTFSLGIDSLGALVLNTSAGSGELEIIGGSGGIFIPASGLPTSAPAPSNHGQIWNNGGVLNIVP